RLIEIGTPARKRDVARLPEPAQMCPPESADPWTGDVFRCLDLRMMLPVIRRPTVRRAGAVEHREEDQRMPDDRVQLDGCMREAAVIAHRHAESAKPGEADRDGGDAPAGPRECEQADDGEQMNGDDVEKRRAIAPGRLPPGCIPWFGAETGDNRGIQAIVFYHQSCRLSSRPPAELTSRCTKNRRRAGGSASGNLCGGEAHQDLFSCGRRVDFRDPASAHVAQRVL